MSRYSQLKINEDDPNNRDIGAIVGAVKNATSLFASDGSDVHKGFLAVNGLKVPKSARRSIDQQGGNLARWKGTLVSKHKETSTGAFGLRGKNKEHEIWRKRQMDVPEARAYHQPFTKEGGLFAEKSATNRFGSNNFHIEFLIKGDGTEIATNDEGLRDLQVRANGEPMNAKTNPLSARFAADKLFKVNGSLLNQRDIIANEARIRDLRKRAGALAPKGIAGEFVGRPPPPRGVKRVGEDFPMGPPDGPGGVIGPGGFFYYGGIGRGGGGFYYGPPGGGDGIGGGSKSGSKKEIEFDEAAHQATTFVYDPSGGENGPSSPAPPRRSKRTKRWQA